jgi:hypothetical protein
MLARELPTVELTAPVAERRVHEVLIGAGLASSTSDVNRLLKQRGVRVNARVVGEDGALEEADLVGGRYVLVRQGQARPRDRHRRRSSLDVVTAHETGAGHNPAAPIHCLGRSPEQAPPEEKS